MTQIELNVRRGIHIEPPFTVVSSAAYIRFHRGLMSVSGRILARRKAYCDFNGTKSLLARVVECIRRVAAVNLDWLGARAKTEGQRLTGAIRL